MREQVPAAAIIYLQLLLPFKTPIWVNYSPVWPIIVSFNPLKGSQSALTRRYHRLGLSRHFAVSPKLLGYLLDAALGLSAYHLNQS